MNSRLTAIPTLLALACSHTVELGEVPKLTSSTDPTVLGSISEQVESIQVDDERLYWTGTQGGPFRDFGDSALRSCKKRDCVGSLVTYDAFGVNGDTNFAVENGQIYWLHLLNKDPTHWALRACDVGGCAGEPRTVSPDFTDYPTTSAFTPDAMYLFAQTGGLYRVALAGTGVTPEHVLDPGQTPQSLAVQDGYAYWISFDFDKPRESYNLQRARLDGTGSIQLVASNFDAGNYYATNETWLALDETYVYWSQGGLSGSIARCPLTGCVANPEVFASPIRSPTSLKVDADHLYWEHDTSMQGFAVSGCKRAACVMSKPIALGVDYVGPLAFDAQYFYTATINQEISRSTSEIDMPAQIRRIPK